MPYSVEFNLASARTRLLSSERAFFLPISASSVRSLSTPNKCWTQRLISIATPQALRRHASQPAGLIHAACTILNERTGYYDAELAPLARSQLPVALVHGSKDVAYPAEYYAQFTDQLVKCGVTVRLHEIDGAPHLASATHYEK